MTRFNEVLASVELRLARRAEDELAAAAQLRDNNIARMYHRLVEIIGAVQDDMYDRFGIPMNLYVIDLADICDAESNWAGGTDQTFIDECGSGQFPVAVDIACDIDSMFADLRYTVGGLVRRAAGSPQRKVQDSLVTSFAIESVNMGGIDVNDDKSLLELLRENDA